MEISFCPLYIPNNIFYNFVMMSSQSPIGTLKGTQEVIRRLSVLCCSSREFSKKIDSVFFFMLFGGTIHPFFLPKEGEDASNWKALQKERFKALKDWRIQPFQVQFGQAPVLSRLHVLCKNSDLAFCGLKTVGNPYVSQSTSKILQRISESGQVEQLPLVSMLAPPYSDPSIVHFKEYTALLSDYNVVYLYSWVSKELVKVIVLEEGLIEQIEMKDSKLFLRISMPYKEVQLVHIYGIENLSSSPQSITIPFNVVKIFFLDDYCFFLQKTEAGQMVFAIESNALQTLCSGTCISFPLSAGALCIEGEKNELLAVEKQGRKICIKQIYPLEKGFESSSFSLQVPSDCSGAAVLTVYYHLEKVFICLEDFTCLIYDISVGSTRAVQFLNIYPEGWAAEDILDKKIVVQFLSISSKVYCMFNGLQSIDYLPKICSISP